jgi:tetratricopeptide (TPR) repeat protein
MILRSCFIGLILAVVGSALDLVPGPALGQPAAAPILRGYLSQVSRDNEGALSGFREAIRMDPQSAEARSLAAHVLASDHRFSEALEIVEDGLQERPNHPALLLWKAKLLEALGRRDEAVEAAREAALGGAAGAYAFALRLLDAAGKTSESAELASAWVAKDPRSPEPRFALAQALLRLGNKAGAHEAFDKALELAPNHLPTLRSLADLQEQEGNADAAEVLYRKVIELNPHDLDARFRLGQILVRKKKVDEVIALFKDLERWNGQNRGASLRFGMLLLQGDRAAEAEEVFRRIADAQPDDTAAWYLLGASLQAQERYEAALDAYSRVPEGATEYVDTLVRRALALRALKRAGEGLDLLRGWIEAHPNDEEVALALADFLEDQEDFRGAVKVLEDYLARSETKNPQVFFSLGVLYDKLKDWERSAEYMTRSLDLNPDDPHALNYLGYTYAERGVRLDEAEKLITRALELKPGDGAITDSLGWVYYKQGRFSEAATQLRRAVELLPKDPVIWEHLGDVLKALGETSAAREAYGKAVEFDPESGPARQKLEALP